MKNYKITENISKIISAIVLLVVISLILKIAQYFEYNIEPDRTRLSSFKDIQQKQKQQKLDNLIDQIIQEKIK